MQQDTKVDMFTIKKKFYEIVNGVVSLLLRPPLLQCKNDLMDSWIFGWNLSKFYPTRISANSELEFYSATWSIILQCRLFIDYFPDQSSSYSLILHA
jgi:hypothetical protein